MTTETVYGFLLFFQILTAMIVLFSIEIAFFSLLFICFCKGLLYQYEHFKNEEIKKDDLQ